MNKKTEIGLFTITFTLILFSFLSNSIMVSGVTEGVSSIFEIEQEDNSNTGDLGTDSYHSHPQINNEELDHDYTKVDVNNIITTSNQLKSSNSPTMINSHTDSFNFDEEVNYAGYNPDIETSLDYQLFPNHDYPSDSALHHTDGIEKRLDGPELYEMEQTTTQVGYTSWEHCTYSVDGYGVGYEYRLEFTSLGSNPDWGPLYVDTDIDLSADYTINFLPHSAIYLGASVGEFKISMDGLTAGVTADIEWQIIVKDYTKSYTNTINKDNSYLFNNLEFTADLYQVDSMSISVGTDTVYSTGYHHDHTISQDINCDYSSDDITIDIEYFSQTGYVDLDKLIFTNVYEPFDDLSMELYYKIGSGTAQSTTLDLESILSVPSPSSISDLSESLTQTIDVTDFEGTFNYNTQSFTILSNSIDFSISNTKNKFTFDFSFEISTFRNYVPSEINLQCNGKDINDLSTTSGFCVFDEYQTSFTFTSDISSVDFTYDVSSYFNLNITLEEISSSYLYKAISVSSDTNLDITYVEHSIVDIKYWSISEYSYDSDPNNYASYTDFSVGDGSNIYLELITSEDIHKQLSFVDSYIYDGDITTNDDLVSYIYSYENYEAFNFWFIETPDFTHHIDPLVSLDSFVEGESICMIEESLTPVEVINFRVYKEAIFTIDYEEISTNDQETLYEIKYSANFDIDDVDLKVELPKYYQNWNIGTQNDDKVITIEDLDFTSEIQTIEITGSIPDPSLISYKSFELESPHQIFEPDGKIVDVKGNLDLDNNFAHHFEAFESNWIIDKVYDFKNNEYEINEQNNIFNQSNVLDPYLSFQCNPIQQYNITQNKDNITITINTDLNISNINIMFYIENLEHNVRVLNDSAHYVGDDGEVTWYYDSFNLKTGENVFTINFEEQTPSKWSKYIVIFIIIAFVGYTLSKSDWDTIKSKIKNIGGKK